MITIFLLVSDSWSLGPPENVTFGLILLFLGGEKVPRDEEKDTQTIKMFVSQWEIEIETTPSFNTYDVVIIALNFRATTVLTASHTFTLNL